MNDNDFWKYPEKNQYPKTKDGLIFCELIDGRFKKLLYFNLDNKHFFYDGDHFYHIKRWCYF